MRAEAFSSNSRFRRSRTFHDQDSRGEGTRESRLHGVLTASLARTPATRAQHHEAALTAPRARFPTELPDRRRGATKSYTRDPRTCAGVRRLPRHEPAAGSSRRRVAGGAGEGRSRAGPRARGVPTPHRVRRHDARASLQHAHARARTARAPPTPYTLPTRWWRRSPHSCCAACVPVRGDRDGEARLEPTRRLVTRCAPPSRSPSLCATPVRRPLARPTRGYDSCVCRVLGASIQQRAKSMPCRVSTF